MKICQDCKNEYSELSFHTGHEKWCEDCFDKGLTKNMDDHFLNFIESEIEDKP